MNRASVLSTCRTLGRPLLRLLPPSLSGRLAMAVQERLVPNPLTVHGLKVFRHPLNVDPSRMAMALGTYEPMTTEFVKSFAPHVRGFADVGGHIGYFALLVAKLSPPEARVWTFEPLPASRTLLERNIEINALRAKVTIVPKAILESERKIQFFTHVCAGRSSAVSREGATTALENSILATSLDIFFGEHGWPAVNLVKIDIEGAELEALSGMKELTRRNRDMHLVIEMNCITLKAAKNTATDLWNKLTELGFSSIEALDVKGRPAPITIRSAQELEALNLELQQNNAYANLVCRN